MSTDYGSFDVSKLNQWTRRFIENIFEWRPEWKYLSEIYEEEDSKWAVLIKVPSKITADDRVLIIDTGNDEVTVSFSFWHEHFESIENPDDLFRDLKITISDILNDELFILCAINEKTKYWRVELASQLTESNLLEYITDPRLSGNLKLISFGGTVDDEISLSEIERVGAKLFVQGRKN